jgi:hypothetical protein
MDTALIFGDSQIPLHDPLAWEVMLQIGEEVKPSTLIVNGDFVEWRHLSLRYAARDVEGFAGDVEEETSLANEKLTELCRRVKAKRKIFNEGNHEWRLFRALSQIPQILKLLKIKEIQRAVSVETILRLEERGFTYSGEYPAGTWCFGVNREHDVFVHHSYTTRKKSGYMAHAEIDTRLCSTVTGHGERLACVWRRGMDRRLFACEGGNLSILGEPKRGQGIYGSIPFNDPSFLDRQQGVVVLYRDGYQIYPFPVPIHNGRAVFMGRLFKA